MKKQKEWKAFDTDKRIRLGIWGLGRGMSFYRTCRSLNMDIIAGCDFNTHMRERFVRDVPGAFVTENADEFLAQDFDAVLLATYCVAHAEDAIKCLRAGKHVLSEVTSFFNMAQGVRLVEEVEKSGKVYQLAENYPFTPVNQYLARKWKEGLFGELMYAEYEYVHECRKLCYTYIDDVPVQPGNTVHNWRNWMNYHYYCTHSLGPVMVITGTRPTKVVALPGHQKLTGYLVDSPRGMGGVTPSLIAMNNGGLVRNLMGVTTNDTHVQRLWGTLGAAEVNVGKNLQLRLGASGSAPKLEVVPDMDELMRKAVGSGHGGGDFWVMYYFARQILTGERGPFDIYSAADVTIPGILAYRSSMEGGKTYDVPDFQNKAERDAWRNDVWMQERYDTEHAVFAKGADKTLTSRFTTVMKQLIAHSIKCRAAVDWLKVLPATKEPAKVIEMVENVVMGMPAILETYGAARKLADATPGSDGARVLQEMLDIGLEKEVVKPAFLADLKKLLATLRRKYPAVSITMFEAEASALVTPAVDIAKIRKPDKKAKRAALKFNPADGSFGRFDLRPLHGEKNDGLTFVRGAIKTTRDGAGRLFCETLGQAKIWLNGKEAGRIADRNGAGRNERYSTPVKVKKGVNEIWVALSANGAKNTALGLRFEFDAGKEKR